MLKRALKLSVALSMMSLYCATLDATALSAGQAARKGASVGIANACAACHTADSLTQATSKYFEHYRAVHREVFKRQFDCATCHSPFFNEGASGVKDAKCAACHNDERKASLVNAATSHAIHVSKQNLACAMCHDGATHKIDRMQILDACSNCH